MARESYVRVSETLPDSQGLRTGVGLQAQARLQEAQEARAEKSNVRASQLHILFRARDDKRAHANRLVNPCDLQFVPIRVEKDAFCFVLIALSILCAFGASIETLFRRGGSLEAQARLQVTYRHR